MNLHNRQVTHEKAVKSISRICTRAIPTYREEQQVTLIAINENALIWFSSLLFVQKLLNSLCLLFVNIVFSCKSNSDTVSFCFQYSGSSHLKSRLLNWKDQIDRSLFRFTAWSNLSTHILGGVSVARNICFICATLHRVINSFDRGNCVG